MNFSEKYKKEIDSVQFSGSFETFLIDEMKGASKINISTNTVKRNKAVRVLLAVISAIVILSVSAFALTSLRSPVSPDKSSEKASNTIFENRWKKSKKFPYESGNEEYMVTLLGIASGSFLNSCDGFSGEENKSYIVVAIRNEGVSSLNLKDGTPLQISPFIYGREPWETNYKTLCPEVKEFEKNGVLYYLFDTSFLDAFAGRTVYISAYEKAYPISEIFTMKEDGAIAFSESYDGLGALWELPADISQANPQKAEEMLEEDTLGKLNTNS